MANDKPFFSSLPENEGMVAVLCLEDDFAMQQVLEAFISADPTVTTWMAACGAEALDILEDEGCLPDLILLDHALLGETGEEAAATIRKEYGAGIPMVLCSACDPSLAEELRVTCNCVDFLPKPYTQAAVLDVIKRHAVGRSAASSGKPA